MKSIPFFTALVLAAALPACGDKTETFGGKFVDMRDCLDSLREVSKKSLKIVTDQPEQISGLLSDGNHFGCTLEKTGSSGTYVSGWYTKAKP